MDQIRKKPTPSVKLASALFLLAGVVLFIGLIKSFQEISLNQSNFNIFIVYILLLLLCFFVSFGLYRHKKWALYTGYAFGIYLVVNFILNMRSNFTADIIIAGLPILLAAIIIISILAHKHKHFIH